jgi:hypothetical protein
MEQSMASSEVVASEEAASTFVFYNLNAAHSWTYPDLPPGWRWLGSGRVWLIGATP